MVSEAFYSGWLPETVLLAVLMGYVNVKYDGSQGFMYRRCDLQPILEDCDCCYIATFADLA